jgi:uncharacterized protein (DUF1501 family)
MLIRSRREFIRDTVRSVTALGAAGALGRFGEMNALAAGSSNYQALVCVFLLGGNDGHNTVIPITTAQQNYTQYAQNRGGLALAQSSLLPIANGSDTYGLHPNLPEIQGLYNKGKAAILANVGMLVTPLTQAQYLSNNSLIIPSALFSHSDQSSQWQTGIPAGNGSTGWGGRISDYMQAQNGSAVFPSMSSMGSCGLFCTGAQTFPATVPPPSGTGATGVVTLSGLAGSRQTGMQALLTFSNGVQLVQSASGVMTRGNNYADTLTGLLTSNNITTVFPSGNPLAAQLLTVANVMSVRSQLGLTRQVFFCLLDGFDTHSGQIETQGPLLQQLSQAVSAFYAATQELGIDQNVTTFTASEFGRTLTPSGSDGSDHAWGNHHFIIGSGVEGGKFYGNFPLLAPGASDDATGRGALIPTTAVDQYGATLAQWFGVPTGNLPQIFPNIGNFPSNSLGFLS